MEKEIVFKGNQTIGFLDDLLATIFGEENVDTILKQAQAAATTVAVNKAGEYVQTNPDAVKAITGTGKESVLETLGEIYKQYKPVIWGVTGVAALTMAYGIYSMAQAGKLARLASKKTKRK